MFFSVWGKTYLWSSCELDYVSVIWNCFQKLLYIEHFLSRTVRQYIRQRKQLDNISGRENSFSWTKWAQFLYIYNTACLEQLNTKKYWNLIETLKYWNCTWPTEIHRKRTVSLQMSDNQGLVMQIVYTRFGRTWQ